MPFLCVAKPTKCVCAECDREIKGGDWYWTVAAEGRVFYFCSQEHIRQKFGDIS